MKDYKLTIENGVITWVENADENGNTILGRLFIPKEVTAFDVDAWVFLGCEAEAIVVDPENDVFSSAHNCLLSKDGKKLIKVCKNSDVSKLTSLEIIGQDAFNDLNVECDEFVFRIPDGVKILDYRAFAINMQKLYKRTENIRDKKVGKSEDNMLKISTDGRKAALSLELVDEEQPYDEHCKIHHCIENVMDIYKKHEGCSQLIFCDYSTPQNSRYSVYKDLKARFIECGVPASEIAFIHSCKNEEQKVKLYDAVNSGKVRILMGSTFKLGIGANVQTKLKAIHHVDVPWRPADMVQREGRILRRGNENDEVKIYRYIVEGSFDSYSWQILQTKQHFISQFLSGNSTTRSIEDFTNDELNYAQVKALALSEPLMKEYVEKENALRNARLVLRQEIMQKETAKLDIKRIDEEQKQLDLRREKTTQNAEYVEKNIVDLRTGCSSIAEIVTSKLGAFSHDREIAKIGEFSLRFPHTQSEKKQFLIFERLNTEYYVEFGDSISGNKTRLSNFFEKFKNQVASVEKRYDELEKKKENLKNQIQYCSGIEKKIKKLEDEKQVLFDKLSVKKE